MLVLILDRWQLMVLKQSFSFLHRNRTWIAWATSLVAQMVKNLPAMQETWVRSLGWKDPLEKGMAAHSSTLAWRSPWNRQVVGYSTWGCKESDVTDFHFHLFNELPEI